MTDTPAAKSAEPERPHHADGNPPNAATHTRSRRKKVLVPLVLAVIGLALLAFGLGMYPRRAEASAPSYATVGVQGNSYVLTHLGNFFYTVKQVKPDLARVAVMVGLTADRVPHGTGLQIRLIAVGFTIVGCSPSPGCSIPNGTGAANFSVGPGPRYYSADFLVRAHSFGVNTNGVTAAAALPTLAIGFSSRPEFLNVSYQIPSASSYDWSSYPTLALGPSGAIWEEPLQPGVTNARVVTGTNHAAQQRDSNFTLIAGILFGIAGGALIAALQELLRD